MCWNRSALRSRSAFTTARANVARMYAHWLGGKDSFEADRAAADSVLVRFPEVAEVARANRAFLARAVRHVARQGVRQFIDFGAGLPASPNVHEIAREHVPDARVVYLDHDPVVLSHARALLAIDENIGVVAGDLREPAVSMADPVLARLITRTEPVCVILGCVLHFLAAEEADAAVAWLRQWMASGSYLVISAGTSTGTDPELLQQLQSAFGDTAPVTGRTAGEITAWFDGLAVEQAGRGGRVGMAARLAQAPGRIAGEDPGRCWPQGPDRKRLLAMSRDARDVLAAGDVLSWPGASVHVPAGRA